MNNLQRGELNLGSSLTIGNYWLPSKLSQFKQQFPGISVNCTLGNAEEIAKGTATGRFDLGLVTGDVKPALRDILEQTVVGSERLQIVVGRSHPWFKRSEVRTDELVNTHWIIRESGSGAQQRFEQALQSWNVNSGDLKIVLVLTSSEMVKAVVEGGIGAAALPELMVQKELELKTLHALRVIDNHTNPQKSLEILQPIWKLKHRQRFQTQILVAFEQILNNTVAIAS